MLLNLSELHTKYSMKIRGVVQVGCHHAQEYAEYYSLGIRKFVFIEPCETAFSVLKNKFSGVPNVKLYNHACGDVSGSGTMFTGPSNQGMSNSLLRPKIHLTQHPDVIFNDTETVDVERLDKLEFNREEFNLLNMDCQGFEGRVLMGATETIKHIDYVYTEVNRLEMYEGNAMIEDIDKLLSDFQRVETGWASDYHGWGDAMYIRKSLI